MTTLRAGDRGSPNRGRKLAGCENGVKAPGERECRSVRRNDARACSPRSRTGIRFSRWFLGNQFEAGTFSRGPFRRTCALSEPTGGSTALARPSVGLPAAALLDCGVADRPDYLPACLSVAGPFRAQPPPKTVAPATSSANCGPPRRRRILSAPKSRSLGDRRARPSRNAFVHRELASEGGDRSATPRDGWSAGSTIGCLKSPQARIRMRLVYVQTAGCRKGVRKGLPTDRA
jgi:hypothetical protein